MLLFRGVSALCDLAEVFNGRLQAWAGLQTGVPRLQPQADRRGLPCSSRLRNGFYCLWNPASGDRCVLLVITAARLQLALPLPPSVNSDGFEFCMSPQCLLEDSLQPLHAVVPEAFLQQAAGILQPPPSPPPPPHHHLGHHLRPPTHHSSTVGAGWWLWW